jgi:hypothetical protein
MKRRRGRRVFWWWSWLLVLLTIGAVVGGFLHGKKRWEDAPKDFRSVATLSFHVRNPFVVPGQAALVSTSRLADSNEAEVMREIESEVALTPIVTEFDLAQKWGIGTEDALTELRTSLELELDRGKDDLYVIVIRHDPAEAAQLANAVAKGVISRIKVIDERKKVEMAKKLELELQPFVDEEVDARAKIKSALAENNIPIDPQPGMKIDEIYTVLPKVHDAMVEWDLAQRNLVERQSDQVQYTNYWKKSVRPSLVSENAVPALSFIGPELQPFQVEWSLYGLTLGLVVGSLLMLVCWNLFP